MDLLFYLFSALLLGSSLCVVFAKNPVVNVLSLILAIFYSAGLFLLLQAEYLAFSLIIIYVGAVAVLFLFAVMLIAIEKPKKIKMPLSVFSVFLMLEFALLLWHSKAGFTQDEFSTFAFASFKNITNAHALGELLYTYYFLGFQLSGLVLFTAMIGAIVLVYEKRNLIKKQKISEQLHRSKDNSIRLVKVQAEGVIHDHNS